MGKQENFQRIVEKITPLIDSLKTNNSKIDVRESKIDEQGTMTITLSGGLNGNGNWSIYFKDLANIIEKIEENEYHVWIIKLTNDCLDDVFDCVLGISTSE